MRLLKGWHILCLVALACSSPVFADDGDDECEDKDTASYITNDSDDYCEAGSFTHGRLVFIAPNTATQSWEGAVSWVNQSYLVIGEPADTIFVEGFEKYQLPYAPGYAVTYVEISENTHGALNHEECGRWVSHHLVVFNCNITGVRQ